MTRKEIIKLLKSGDFTILYHDNDCCSLYKGHITYDDAEHIKEVHDFDGHRGYTPSEVSLLVKALGGKSDSI
jgi:hypothetical protein